MRFLTAFIIGCIVLAACSGKDKLPASVMPQKKMQDMLWDMMRADQFLANYVLNRDTQRIKKTESLKLYSQILEIHGSTQEEFKTSFLYYKSHPELMNAIMDSISKLSGTAPTQLVKPLGADDQMDRTHIPLPVTDTAHPQNSIKSVPAN